VGDEPAVSKKVQHSLSNEEIGLKGIVHRDLKPANVTMDAECRVKGLDSDSPRSNLQRERASSRKGRGYDESQVS
jgi:serine/threonine protein kinase